MRDIKFRIYFKDEEEFMTKPITIEDLLHEDWIDFENEKGTLSLPLKDFRFFYGKNENYEIMQYTGLKDKNGKEIYEGDIIRFKDRITNKEDVFTVKYSEERASFVLNNKVYDEMTINVRDKILLVEVIGNIYDDPELLEEGE